jgi:hypothetical protein
MSLRWAISWSERTMTGVWYSSAMLKASTVTPNMSSTLIGARIGRTVSPWEENGRGKQVGLLGLGRHAGGGAAALDVDADEGEFGDAGEADDLGLEGEPGPEVAVMALLAGERGTDGAAMPAISSSAWSSEPPCFQMSFWRCCMISVAGVIG